MSPYGAVKSRKVQRVVRAAPVVVSVYHGLSIQRSRVQVPSSPPLQHWVMGRPIRAGAPPTCAYLSRPFNKNDLRRRGFVLR